MKLIEETTQIQQSDSRKHNSKDYCRQEYIEEFIEIISKVTIQQYKGVGPTPSTNTMHLISSNTDSEIGRQIDVEYTGEEMSIGFNISYLQDVIDTLEGSTVHICINDQNSGCVIQDNQDPNLYLSCQCVFRRK